MLSIDRITDIYFDSFGIEYIPQEVLYKIKDKSITHNIFRIQENDCIMCEIYCIAFIEYMLAGRTLLDYTNLISMNVHKKMTKKYISILRVNMPILKSRFKKLDETRNYLLEEVKYNYLISKKYKKDM